MTICTLGCVALAACLTTPTLADGLGTKPEKNPNPTDNEQEVVAGDFEALAGLGENTIAGIVASSGGEFDGNLFDYDILLNAVVTAGLVDALDDPDADLTVFAPNDLAFIRLARDLGYDGWSEDDAWTFLVAALTDLGGGDPIPVLTNVLLYHVAGESITAFDFILLSIFNEPVETLLANEAGEPATFQPFFLFLIDNEPDLKDPTLFLPINVFADNGVIHTIGRVLLPVDLP